MLLAILLAVLPMILIMVWLMCRFPYEYEPVRTWAWAQEWPKQQILQVMRENAMAAFEPMHWHYIRSLTPSPSMSQHSRHFISLTESASCFLPRSRLYWSFGQGEHELVPDDDTIAGSSGRSAHTRV
jgi:hypothetical protein